MPPDDEISVAGRNPVPLPEGEEAQLDHALQHFEDALGLIEADKKSAYQDALENCADIVQMESPPELFLKACDWDPWKAAQKMVDYWRERVDLFGERAFYPLTACSVAAGTENADGVAEKPMLSALSEEDIEILETGSVQVLPPDKDGRSVVFMDRSLLKQHMFHMTRPRLRVLWYILQKALLRDVSVSGSSHRVVVLALACRPPVSGYDWDFPRGCRLLTQVLPMCVGEIHLLTLPATTGTGRLLQAVVNTLLTFCGPIFANVHFGASSSCATAGTDPHSPQSHLLQELKQCGFAKKGLPSCAGGNFGPHRFNHWLCRQRTFERQLYLSSNEMETLKRRRNNVHSKQKRQRRQQELDTLQQEALQLKRENAEAKQVCITLERLLQCAQEQVKDLECAGKSVAATNPTGPSCSMVRAEASSQLHMLLPTRVDPLDHHPACRKAPSPSIEVKVQRESFVKMACKGNGELLTYNNGLPYDDCSVTNECLGWSSMGLSNITGIAEPSWINPMDDIQQNQSAVPVPVLVSLSSQGDSSLAANSSTGTMSSCSPPFVAPAAQTNVAWMPQNLNSVESAWTAETNTYSAFAALHTLFPFPFPLQITSTISTGAHPGLGQQEPTSLKNNPILMSSSNGMYQSSPVSGTALAISNQSIPPDTIHTRHSQNMCFDHEQPCLFPVPLPGSFSTTVASATTNALTDGGQGLNRNEPDLQDPLATLNGVLGVLEDEHGWESYFATASSRDGHDPAHLLDPLLQTENIFT